MNYVSNLDTLVRAAQAAEEAYLKFLIEQLKDVGDFSGKNLKQIVSFLLAPSVNTTIPYGYYEKKSQIHSTNLEQTQNVGTLLNYALSAITKQDRKDHITSIILERVDEVYRSKTRRTALTKSELPKYLNQPIQLTDNQINRIMGRIKEEFFEASGETNLREWVDAFYPTIKLRFVQAYTNDYDYAFVLGGHNRAKSKYIDSATNEMYEHYLNYIPVEHKNYLQNMHLLDHQIKASHVQDINSNLQNFGLRGTEHRARFLEKIELQMCAYLIIQKLQTNFPIFVSGKDGSNKIEVFLCSELLQSISTADTLTSRVLRHKNTNIGIAEGISKLIEDQGVEGIKNILINDSLIMQELKKLAQQGYGNMSIDTIIPIVLNNPKMNRIVNRRVWETMIKSMQYATTAKIWYSQ